MAGRGKAAVTGDTRIAAIRATGSSLNLVVRCWTNTGPNSATNESPLKSWITTFAAILKRKLAHFRRGGTTRTKPRWR
jgi:hypothetical protein